MENLYIFFLINKRFCTCIDKWHIRTDKKLKCPKKNNCSIFFIWIHRLISSWTFFENLSKMYLFSKEHNFVWLEFVCLSLFEQREITLFFILRISTLTNYEGSKKVDLGPYIFKVKYQLWTMTQHESLKIVEKFKTNFSYIAVLNLNISVIFYNWKITE